MKAHIAVLGGDGIGPEVVAEGLRVLGAVAKTFTYRDESSWHVEVTAAVGMWNESGANIHLVPARRGKHAEIVMIDRSFAKHSAVVGEWSAPFVQIGQEVLHVVHDVDRARPRLAQQRHVHRLPAVHVRPV